MQCVMKSREGGREDGREHDKEGSIVYEVIYARGRWRVDSVGVGLYICGWGWGAVGVLRRERRQVLVYKCCRDGSTKRGKTPR